ncbi:MAG TPA: 5-formyltetrahydrofolate cyclo-ligase [Elusimicrobiota bacterium]|nr:5-formyltetrahydrofolate cyclo-ligase [Elusimicrobiota bacterium]
MSGKKRPSPAELDIRRLKIFYRRLLKTKILAIPLRQRDEGARRVAEHIRKWPRYQRSEIITAYVSADHEMGTEPLLRMARNDGKQVALPVIDSDEMSFSLWNGKRSDLVLNRFGLREPRRSSCRLVSPSRIDLMIVPGRGFSPKGGRLGAGGGFYDRFLSRHPRLHSVGLAFQEQIVRDLPITDHDVPVNAILTPEGWLHRTR